LIRLLAKPTVLDTFKDIRQHRSEPQETGEILFANKLIWWQPCLKRLRF